MLTEQFAQYASAMLADRPLETVAICAAGWWVDDQGALRMLLREWRLAGESDYLRRSPGGAVVKAEFIAPSVKRARDTNESVVLSHTHPFSTTPSFSGIDDGGEDVLVPKIRERAPEGPHGGFVLGSEGGSVRAWPKGSNLPITLALRRIGAMPADVGIGAPEYHRQDLALGPGTSSVLASKHVAVIGAGGLGWPIATHAAAHGVGTITIVDPDVIDETNRPRLPGSQPKHVGLNKVDALAAVLAETRPDTKVVPIVAALADRTARSAIASADAIVVATDNLFSRLRADHFARRLLIPLIDVGVNIELRGQAVRSVGGRVNVSWPLGPCLTCMGVLSPDRVAVEVDPIGYRGTGRSEEAAVMAFNATLAGLAMVELLALVLPMRREARASRYVVYDGLRGVVREIATPMPGACGTCGGLLGAVFGALP